jgi:hypothetical protein
MLDKIKILEEKRRKYIGFLILLFIILFIAVSIFGNFINKSYIAFYGAIIFLAITFFLSFKINKLFEKEFKEFIREYIRNKFSFEYYHSLYIDEKIDNNIFNKTWDFQECKDAIIGVYDNLSFKSYYIKLVSDEEKEVEIFWGKVYVFLLSYNLYKLTLIPNKNKFKLFINNFYSFNIIIGIFGFTLLTYC